MNSICLEFFNLNRPQSLINIIIHIDCKNYINFVLKIEISDNID
jgi:hypothetical protein